MIHFQQPCVGSLAHFGGKIVSRQDSGSAVLPGLRAWLCPLTVNSEHDALMTGSILGK